MKAMWRAVALAAALIVSAPAIHAAETITVYKDPA
jgi:hypothetical protein